MRHRKNPHALVDNRVLHGIREAFHAEAADTTANHGSALRVALGLGDSIFNR